MEHFDDLNNDAARRLDEVLELACACAAGKFDAAGDPGVATRVLGSPAQLRLFQEILGDLLELPEQEKIRARQSRSTTPDFTICGGILRVFAHAGLVFRPLAAFRSGDPGAPVIYSDIIPLDSGCALVELRSSDREMRLNVESSSKNAHAIRISLYKDAQIVDSLTLTSKQSWDLRAFEPGLYRLECNATKALSFQIQG